MEHGSGGLCGSITLAKAHGCYIENRPSNREMLFVKSGRGTMTPMTDEYLYFDEIEDVLSSVDLLAMIVPLVDEQPSYWKWIIVAAHSALQGAMVCALAATSSVPHSKRNPPRKCGNTLRLGRGNRNNGWRSSINC